MNFDPKPLCLEGNHVRLEPLTQQHAEGLFAASRDPMVWTYLLLKPFESVAETAAWIALAEKDQAAGTDVAFATVRKADGRVVGTTRFLDIRRAHRGLEIGWTWLAPEAHRTPINTEAKYLMLTQAFEGWNTLRVQLKADVKNEKSCTAIRRIGAQFEGVLRQHMMRPHDGYVRDTAMFSILRPEWPVVKANLEAKLAKY